MLGQTFSIVRFIQSVILFFLVFVNAVPSFSAAVMEQPDEAAAVDGSAPANSSTAAAPVTADPDQPASGGGNGVGSSYSHSSSIIANNSIDLKKLELLIHAWRLRWSCSLISKINYDLEGV